MMLTTILLSLLACSEKNSTEASSEPSQEPSPTQEPESTEPSEPSAPVGTDNDGDGVTVEDGDCDDDDPWTNPLRDEEGSDGIDNDCDGMIDEKWDGLTIARQSPAGDHTLVHINSVGNIIDETSLSTDCAPAYLSHAEEGWISSAGGSILGAPPFQVVEISAQGDCNVLADFFEDEENPVVRGVVYHPDGYYLASRLGSLIRIDTDGTISELASWGFDPNDAANFQLHIWNVAIHPITMEVGLFGLFGGFATYTEEAGLAIHKQTDMENLEEWDGLYAYSGTVLTQSGWIALVFDSATGETSIRGFDFDTKTWNLRVQWVRADIFPLDIAVNRDVDDFYITANAATYHTVWRVREIDQFIDDLYKSPSMPDYTFQGIVDNYTTF